MKQKKIFALLIALFSMGSVWAQGAIVSLDATNSGTTFDITQGSYQISDDGGFAGDYTPDQDVLFYATGSCSGTNEVLTLQVTECDLGPGDTLFIYDGPSTNRAKLLVAVEGSMVAGTSYYCSGANHSDTLTVRFVADSTPDNKSGWTIVCKCSLPCNTIVPHFETAYYKARNGVIYDTMEMGWRMQVDTLWHYDVVDDPDLGIYNDTTGFDTLQTWFWGLEICEGDSLLLPSYGEHIGPVSSGGDQSSRFIWFWGDGDTLSQTGTKPIGGHKFRIVGCYDVNFSIRDSRSCVSSTQASVRVRIAQMPLKTIFDLPTICNTDSHLVNVGYEGEGATLTLRKIEFAQSATKTYPVRTFIPDGPQCRDAVTGSVCFEASVEFNEFPSGKSVTSKDDICSVCFNAEHTFLGDIRISIACPNGSEAHMKFGNPSTSPGDQLAPRDYSYGGGQDLGYTNSSNTGCDSLNNPFGDGLDYCWSRNHDYTLVNGEAADCDPTDGLMPNPADPGGRWVYIVDKAYYEAHSDRHINGTSGAYQISENHTFVNQIPNYFNSLAGQTTPAGNRTTKRPSNHEDKTDYYLPDDDFSRLVGCPLNGLWSMKVCDVWGGDNGWIFSWSMDICGISSGGCEYQVGLDSVLWLPDSAYGDFDLGHWRGLTMWPRDSVRTYIGSPDTAGLFPVKIHIYDEFGCIWDTTTRIRTVWAPMPHLSDDDTIVLCSAESITLDASDRKTPDVNQTFAWAPYGDSTAVIETRTGLNTSTLYLVEVTNTQYNIRCKTRDSVRVNIYQSPIPNFDVDEYPMEGCEPYTIHFKNTSLYGDKYRWEFGDGSVSTEFEPVHTYATGQYGFKYYVTTNDGCKDSLVYDDLITVFPSPVAKFSWEPINPTVLHPEVHFINMTEPQTDAVKFYWEVQYNRDNRLSVHTMTETNPTFEWTTDGEDISGTYIARLIAKTDERGPSGHTLECRDTVENIILLVNDFLQFPNVITANGDGVNDRFEIKNLVNGLGYPNNSLYIYNRWGKCVYHKKNISSEDDFWDPAAENIPAGTYYWRFTGKGYLGNIERNGVVEVLYE